MLIMPFGFHQRDNAAPAEPLGIALHPPRKIPIGLSRQRIKDANHEARRAVLCFEVPTDSA
jgi:hypothetical protein